MAQDLEKSETGKRLVVEGEDGYKRVKYQDSPGAVFAALANLHGRLKKQEGKG